MDAERHQADPQGPADEWARRLGAVFTDPNAFDTLRRHASGGDRECVEWCPICRGADLLRANAPPELREHWHDLQREALLAIRALIDHYLERAAPPDRNPGPRVQDIPIE